MFYLSSLDAVGAAICTTIDLNKIHSIVLAQVNLPELLGKTCSGMSTGSSSEGGKVTPCLLLFTGLSSEGGRVTPCLLLFRMKL